MASRHRWHRLPTDDQATAWLDAADRSLSDIRSHLSGLLALASLAGKDFPSSLRRDAGGRSSATTSSTERMATSMMPDELEADRNLVQDTFATLASVVSLGQRMSNLRATPVEPSLLPAGAGECVCCGHWCTGQARRTGVEPDRVRAGFCDACYRAWLRAGRPERSAFVLERRDQAARQAA